MFLGDLASRGHALTYYTPETTLKKFGEYLFDNIVMFVSKKTEFTSVSSDDLRDFIDDGGDVLFLANGDISESMRLFAATSGVEFDRKGTAVIDHFSFDQNSDQRYDDFD